MTLTLKNAPWLLADLRVTFEFAFGMTLNLSWPSGDLDLKFDLQVTFYILYPPCKSVPKPQTEDCIQYTSTDMLPTIRRKSNTPHPHRQTDGQTARQTDGRMLFYTHLAAVCPLHKLKTASSTRTATHPRRSSVKKVIQPQTQERTQQQREQQQETHLCLCAGIIGLPRGFLTPFLVFGLSFLFFFLSSFVFFLSSFVFFLSFSMRVSFESSLLSIPSSPFSLSFFFFSFFSFSFFAFSCFSFSLIKLYRP